MRVVSEIAKADDEFDAGITVLMDRMECNFARFAQFCRSFAGGTSVALSRIARLCIVRAGDNPVNRTKTFLQLVCVSLCIGAGGVAQAATYYVSTSGNNGNSCSAAQNSGSPKQTLNDAVGCLAAGDTLLVRGGTYNESLINPSLASGSSWTNKVRIAAYPNGCAASCEVVWMAPSSGTRLLQLTGNQQYIEFDGINMDSRNQTEVTVSLSTGSGANHIRLQYSEIIGSPRSGYCANICGGESSEFIHIVIHGGGNGGGCGSACANAGLYTGGSNNLIDGCDIYDVSMEAIQIYNGSGGTPTNNVIRNCRIHDNVRSGDNNPGARIAGILLAGNNNQIYNNLIYRNGIAAGNGAAINIYNGSGNVIYNNAIYDNVNYGIKLDPGAAGTIVRNNIVYMSGYGDYANNGSGTTEDHNLFSVDPQFVNSAVYDLHIRATSPAKDSGTTISTVKTDFDGVSRPQGSGYDIGPFEYHPLNSASAPQAPSGIRIVTN
jgi:hypothetical protein